MPRRTAYDKCVRGGWGEGGCLCVRECAGGGDFWLMLVSCISQFCVYVCLCVCVCVGVRAPLYVRARIRVVNVVRHTCVSMHYLGGGAGGRAEGGLSRSADEVARRFHILITVVEFYSKQNVGGAVGTLAGRRSARRRQEKRGRMIKSNT